MVILFPGLGCDRGLEAGNGMIGNERRATIGRGVKRVGRSGVIEVGSAEKGKNPGVSEINWRNHATSGHYIYEAA